MADMGTALYELLMNYSAHRLPVRLRFALPAAVLGLAPASLAAGLVVPGVYAETRFVSAGR